MSATTLTILLMALTTYSTRILGYLIFRHYSPGLRMQKVLEVAPGCVLIAVIAPYFVSGKLSDLFVLGITAWAAWKLPLLPTVLIAVSTAGLFRHLL